MRPSRGMGIISKTKMPKLEKASVSGPKMPKAKTIKRRDNPNKVKVY